MKIKNNCKFFALKRSLSDQINQQSRLMRITPKLLWHLLPGILRIYRWARKQRRQGRKPLFDLVMGDFKVKQDKGITLGGLGCGTITRGCRGDFNR